LQLIIHLALSEVDIPQEK